MADSLDDNLYADNDDNIACTPTIDTFNATTGAIETNPLGGRTDGVYFLSLSAATLPSTMAIHSALIVPLVEAASTGIYYGVQQGSDKSTHLADLADKKKIYRHYQFGQDYHRSVLATFRTARDA